MTKLAILVISLFATQSFAPVNVRAQDAEWGCQVLLCAAASNPSWHGIPYCVPPMQKLITRMALLGFTWPSCTAAGTSKPGHEIYDSCPAGMSVGSTKISKRDTNDDIPNLCVKFTPECTDLSPYERDRRNCGEPIESIARPVRAEPYYFDIPNAKGDKERFWFDLQK